MLISRGLDSGRDNELASGSTPVAASPCRAGHFAPATPLAPVDPGSNVDPFMVLLDEDGGVLRATGRVAVPPWCWRRRRATAGPRLGAGHGWLGRGDGTGAVRPWSRPDLKLSGYVIAAQTSRLAGEARAGLIALFCVSGLIALVAASVAVWVATGGRCGH